MSGLRLSICIATLNRAKYLPETLDNLVAQLTDDVEIVILDGGSKDATEEIVGRYVRADPRVRYFRQDTNNGVDRDFDRAVEMARGDYCWLMSDDDLLNPRAVEAVLAALQRNPSLVVVNAEVRNGDMTRTLEPSRLALDEDRWYAPGDLGKLFAEVANYMSFIGCVVIRRELWLARDRESYYGSLFIHMGVTFQEPLPGGALVIVKPLVCIRYGVALWRSREFEIWMFKWPQLVWSFAAVPESVREAVSAREPWRQPSRLLFYRAKGAYGVHDYRKWIRPRVTGAHRTIAALIARVPGVVANAVAVAACRLTPNQPGRGKASNAQRLLDLRNSRFHVRNLLRRPGHS